LEFPGEDKIFQEQRATMVRHQIAARGIRDPRVLDAMVAVPRHLFVPQEHIQEAYDDHPLPIGHGQTISQPYMVALMTEALELKGDEKVLEIGTGSGYQAAILALIAREVYTVERIRELYLLAKERILGLGFKNIFFKLYDGTLGWEEHSPYDAILVTAGAPSVPQPLLNQLKDGGRLVIPVGERHDQELIKITKRGFRDVRENLGGCRFVDLIGVHGWKG
jgi:protein-L-isoaspartate(D-aspartate) O-methyltransferase